MASLVHLDTHVVVWLYLPRLDLVSPEVQRLLESEALEVSPMVLLELAFLREIGRLVPAAHEVLDSLQAQIGLRISRLSFGRVVEASLGQNWTRDPFDRLIVGQARAAGARLVTADDTIRANFNAAVW